MDDNPKLIAFSMVCSHCNGEIEVDYQSLSAACYIPSFRVTCSVCGHTNRIDAADASKRGTLVVHVATN